VIIPNTGIERPFRHGKEDVDDVAWVPTPAPGKKHHITVLLASRGATPKSWSEVVRPTDATLGVLDLRTGDRVLLCQREIPMVEKEASFVLPFVKDMRINYDLEVPEDVQASVFSAGTDDDGHPYLIDMPLGWENVTGPTGAASA